MSVPLKIRPWRSIRDAFAWLLRPPFRTLVVLSILISLVAEGLAPADRPTLGGELVIVVAFLAVQIYIQIAIALAAGSSAPPRSADTWLKAAWRRRCFWRFFLTSILTAIAVAVGLLGLIVGGFIVGGIVGLSQSAAALERRNPIEALFRSAQLVQPARLQVGIVFGALILLPSATVQTAALFRFGTDVTWTAIAVAAEILSATGLIALTKIFVVLGGAPSPDLDRMAPQRPIAGS